MAAFRVDVSSQYRIMIDGFDFDLEASSRHASLPQFGAQTLVLAQSGFVPSGLN
jgi:hypothetical protein